jgi:hypothetical protein
MPGYAILRQGRDRQLDARSYQDFKSNMTRTSAQINRAEKVAALGVTEYTTISRQLITKIFPLFSSESVPTDIKVFLGLLLYLILHLSAGLAILLANVAVYFAGGAQINFEYYLIFVGFSVVMIFTLLLLYSGRALRFENTHNFEQRLEDISTLRRARQRRSAPLTPI